MAVMSLGSQANFSGNPSFQRQSSVSPGPNTVMCYLHFGVRVSPQNPLHLLAVLFHFTSPREGVWQKGRMFLDLDCKDVPFYSPWGIDQIVAGIVGKVTFPWYLAHFMKECKKGLKESMGSLVNQPMSRNHLKICLKNVLGEFSRELHEVHLITNPV